MFCNPFWQPLRIYIPQFFKWFWNFFSRVEDWKKILVFITLVFKSWGEVANFGFNFSANFSRKQNNATNLESSQSQISLQISTITWKLKKKLLMSKNGTRLRFWNSLPQKKTRIAAAITTWFQNKLIILDSIIYLPKCQRQ